MGFSPAEPGMFYQQHCCLIMDNVIYCECTWSDCNLEFGHMVLMPQALNNVMSRVFKHSDSASYSVLSLYFVAVGKKKEVYSVQNRVFMLNGKNRPLTAYLIDLDVINLRK